MDREARKALLGDSAAQERLTERGVLLPCSWCRKIPGEDDLFFRYGKYSLYHDCKKAGPMRIKGRSRKEVCLNWNTRTPILSAEELEAIGGKL